MKKLLIFFLILMIFAFSGCSTGDSNSDSGLVQVSLGISSSGSQKIVTASGSPDPANFRFFIQALPEWSGVDYIDPVGKIAQFTKIDTYTPGMSLGYFAQGQWTFNVEIRDTDETTVLYSGSTTTYINSSNSSVIVSVSSAMTGNGKISINISAPTVADGNTSDDTFVITYGNNVEVPVVITRDMETNMTVASLVPTDFASGNYLFTIKHKNGTAEVGGAIVSVTIFPDITTTLSGTVEAGRWVAEQLTLTGITTATMTVEATGGAVTVPKNTDLVFTASVTIEGATVNAYQWYVNGERPESGENGNRFTFRKSKKDYYQVFCVAQASDGTLVGCEAYITVTD